MKAFFPNAITSLNLLFGCIGILACFNGGLGFAGICILISATLDFFDGFVARLLGVSGDFGKQLDSLADVISFGALPGFIALNLIKQQQGGLYFDGEPLTNKIFLIICFLIPIFSALRLAKFNIDEGQTDSFIGVPTPANAMFWSGLAIVWTYDQNSFLIALLQPEIILALVVICSVLLVLPVKMIALKFKSFGIKENLSRYLFVLGALIVILISMFAFTPGYALVFLYLWYVIFSMLSGLVFKQ